LAFNAKARNVATCDQVFKAEAAAIAAHKKDFDELVMTWEKQREQDRVESLMRRREITQREMWAIEDRMAKEGRTPYLLERWRALKLQLEAIDLELTGPQK
jgi:hypothetical protein